MKRLLVILVFALAVAPVAAAGKGPYRYTKIGHIGAPGQFKNGASGIAIDQTCGDIYIVDVGARIVRRYDENGKFIGNIGAPNSKERGGLLGPVGIFLANAAVQPQNPLGPPTACGGDGFLWVADYFGHRVDAFDSKGEVQAVWCATENPAGVCDITYRDNFDYLPNDVWTTDNNVYVAGRLANLIREYSLDGTYVRTSLANGGGYTVAIWGINLWTTYEGNGSTTVGLYSTDPSTANIELVHKFPWKLKGTFEGTSGLYTGIDGTLYAIDRVGLQVFSPSGILRSTTPAPLTSDLAVRYDGIVYVTSHLRPGADIYSPGALVTLTKQPGGLREIVLAGRVTPGHPQNAIVLQRAEGNGWHTLTTLKLDASSSFVYHWAPPRRLVHYRVRAFFKDPHPYHADRESAILDVASR